MSRYKKAINGEMTLPEIGGIEFVIYPTLEHRSELLDLFKEAQVDTEIDFKEGGSVIRTERKKNGFDIKRMVELLTDIVFEACYNHNEKGQRLVKKTDEQDTTREDVKHTILTTSPIQIFMEVATHLNIMPTKERQEIDKQIEEAKKNSSHQEPVLPSV